MKHLKRGLIVFVVLILCLITTWFIIKKYYLLEIVHTRIEQSIADQIENEFQFNLDNFKLNLFTSKAKLRGITFLMLDDADTVGYFKGDVVIDLRSWKNVFFDSDLIINNLFLENTTLYYSADRPLIMKDNKDENGSDSKIEIINASIKGALKFANKHKEQSGQLSANFDVHAALNFNSTDSLSIDYLIKQLTNFQLLKLHYYLPDGFYQLMIEEVAFSDFDAISLKKIIINPIDSRRVFAQRKNIATDFISVAVDSIKLVGFDDQIQKHLYIDQIHVHHPSIDVFKDKNYPDNVKFKAVLVDMLKDLTTPVYIRATVVNDMFIKYTELAAGADEAGDLFFSEAKATISNITNVRDSVERSSKMLIEAEAKFYGQGFLKTKMRYELLSPSGQFDISGSLSPMDIGKANAIVSKLAPVRIKSGNLDKLRFNFSGTSNQSVGEMWFEYSDLNIQILELNNMNNNFTKNLLSSIGNRMMRNSNPTGNGIFRVGEIKQDRDITKSMFNFWWISLQSGFISTLDVTKEKREINYKSGEAATFLDKIGLGEK